MSAREGCVSCATRGAAYCGRLCHRPAAAAGRRRQAATAYGVLRPLIARCTLLDSPADNQPDPPILCPLSPPADFFRQQPRPAAKPLPAADEPPRRPVRESLLVVARNSQVKNKISAFDKQQAGGAALTGLTAARPAARRTGAAPALGAIAEEAPAPPARRHAAVVSTAFAAAPPRRHVAAVQTAPAAQPPAIAVPSPATKQQVAEKRHAAHFPSIMFQAPQPEAPARLPLAGGVAVLPPLPAAQPQVPAQPTPPQLRPLPGVLAPARASLSPRLQPALAAQPALLPQAVAKVLATEAAAVAAAESDDERDYVDAASGGPSQEGSAGAWVGSVNLRGAWS